MLLCWDRWSGAPAAEEGGEEQDSDNEEQLPQEQTQQRARAPRGEQEQKEEPIVAVSSESAAFASRYRYGVQPEQWGWCWRNQGINPNSRVELWVHPDSGAKVCPVWVYAPAARSNLAQEI